MEKKSNTKWQKDVLKALNECSGCKSCEYRGILNDTVTREIYEQGLLEKSIGTLETAWGDVDLILRRKHGRKQE